jgi:hypothetical protein
LREFGVVVVVGRLGVLCSGVSNFLKPGRRGKEKEKKNEKAPWLCFFFHHFIYSRLRLNHLSLGILNDLIARLPLDRATEVWAREENDKSILRW